MGSSRTRDRTHVPCIGRWILNHCTAREVPADLFYVWFIIMKKIRPHQLPERGSLEHSVRRMNGRRGSWRQRGRFCIPSLGAEAEPCPRAWRGGAGLRGVSGAERRGPGHGFGCRAGKQAPAPAPAQVPECWLPSHGPGRGSFGEQMVNCVWNYLSSNPTGSTQRRAPG